MVRESCIYIRDNDDDDPDGKCFCFWFVLRTLIVSIATTARTFRLKSYFTVNDPILYCS